MSINQTTTQDTPTHPIISFVVTTYNLPLELLQECLNSIFSLSLNQQEREIIIVDDGSDISLINDLIANRDNIIYIRQRNSGVSVARNTGISICSGKYIQFVDGDDALIQSSYEHCLDIVRYHNPDIVTFNFIKKNCASSTFFLPNPISGTEYLHQYNLHGSACLYIFRKSILGSLRFSKNIRYGEDEEFTPQLFLRAGTIYKTDAKAYFYKQRNNSVTNQLSTRSIAQRLLDTENVIYSLQELSSIIPEAERVALNRRVIQLTMDYIYNVINLTRSNRQLDNALQRLRNHGLYPLPDKKFTKKYSSFRKMINSRIGRKILLLTIPKINSK